MGTKNFFKQPSFNTPNLNMEGRAIGAGSYAGVRSGGAAAKDLAAAMAMSNKHGLKPSERGAAYPPGPKKV